MSGLWSRHLVGEALTEPVKISAAVLVFGLLFRWCRDVIRNRVSRLARGLGLPSFVFALVVGLGVPLGLILMFVYFIFLQIAARSAGSVP